MTQLQNGQDIGVEIKPRVSFDHANPLNYCWVDESKASSFLSITGSLDMEKLLPLKIYVGTTASLAHSHD